MKIYVEFKAPATLEEFLEKFFSYSPAGHPNPYRANATFLDEECTKMQCLPGKSRSIQDMYDLVTTYYPDTTLEELVAALIRFRPGGVYWFVPSFCSDINRPVMNYSFYQSYSFPAINSSQWNWGRILESMGIHSTHEMYTY